MIKKIFLFLFLTSILFNDLSFAKDRKIQYTNETISDYFYGIVSASKNETDTAYQHLNKIQFIKDSHSNFNVKFIHTLILLEKYKQAFNFAKSVWSEDNYILEVDLLIGLDFFIKKNYSKAEKHFKRLNDLQEYNLFFDDFLGNVLIGWTRASQNKQQESFEILNKIPERYYNLKQVQNSFLQCYFDTNETQNSFAKLVEDEDYSFSRYNFFLANYLLHKNENEKAYKVIIDSRKKHFSNLLIKQTENFILNKKIKKIKNFFDCKNPKDNMAEIFYILANLYSTQNDYKLSNFYLKISFLLNDKFIPNKTLLAENFFYQQKYNLSKKTYNSIKSIGPLYSWYASKNISLILLKIADKEASIKNLKNDFNLLKNPNYEHYYELANFYKDIEYYKDSIKYYTLALENIENNHALVPKILDRRGTSYERSGDWDKAENDLEKSLKKLPDQPHVLNYLAYSWVEKRIHLEKAIKMLLKATSLRKNDGYIIDSLGWAYFVNKNYIDAEKFLQKAVELMPQDPVINDHYADALWMLDKSIQARYVWKYVLGLESAEQKLKENINQKLIFGIKEKL